MPAATHATRSISSRWKWRKGPSSSIAGRGTTGGAINQVTKSALARALVAEATLVGGLPGAARGTVDFNQPIGEERRGISLRLNAIVGDASVPGRDVVENQSWGVAPSFAVGIGSRRGFHDQVAASAAEQRARLWRLPWGVYPDYPTGAFDANPPVDQGNFYGLRDYDFEDIDSDVVSGEVHHRFVNGMTLRNLTRYSDTNRESAITAPRPPNRQLQRRTMGNEQLANHTNLNAAHRRGPVRREPCRWHRDRARDDVESELGTIDQSARSHSRDAKSGRTAFWAHALQHRVHASETGLGLIGLYTSTRYRSARAGSLPGGVRWGHRRRRLSPDDARHGGDGPGDRPQRRHAQLARRRAVQASRRSQPLPRVRDLVQPVGGCRNHGCRVQHGTDRREQSEPRAGGDAEL